MPFGISRDLFLESRDTVSRVVALDEAHKVEISFSATLVRRLALTRDLVHNILARSDRLYR